MLKTIHFHPNKKMAQRFVIPLVNAEKKIGIRSRIVYGDAKQSKNFNISAKSLLMLPYIYYKINSYIQKNSPQVVIAHNSTSSLLPLISARINGVKRIIYFNHGIPFLAYNGILRLALNFIEILNCHLSTEVLTVSKDLKYHLKKYNNNTNIINNGSACGINIENLNISYRKNFRKKLGIKESDFTIAFIGRPEKRKGYNFTIELWKKYFSKNNDCKLLIYGPQKTKPCNLNMINNIYFMGFTNNIKNVLSGIDCVILPSKHEGLSYIALEATMQLCPVVCSNIEGLNSIIINNQNGYKPNLKYLDFVKALNKVREKKILRSDQIKIRNKIYKKYNRKEFMKKYIQFIQGVNS